VAPYYLYTGTPTSSAYCHVTVTAVALVTHKVKQGKGNRRPASRPGSERGNFNDHFELAEAPRTRRHRPPFGPGGDLGFEERRAYFG
jgi:hypothetical protein